MKHTKNELRLYYGRLRDNGRLSGTIKRAVDIRLRRDHLATIKQPTGVRKPVLLAVGPKTGVEALARRQAEYPRRHNWTIPAPTFEPSHLRTNNEGQYSSRCSYNHYTYTPCVQSFVYVFQRQAVAVLEGKRHIVRAPKGYHWKQDNAGAKLVRNRDNADYHPNCDDIATGIRHIVSRLDDNANLRKQAERAAHDLAKRAKAVWVCRRDSIAAGNCGVGTEHWVRTNNLPGRHLRGDILLRLARKENNGDIAQRIRNSVVRAIKRQDEEVARGYSNLSYHY